MRVLLLVIALAAAAPVNGQAKSTGGFTDCLLQRGAAQVVAVDVGHGQLHPAVREDPRVDVRERCNVRHLTRETIGGPVDLVVAVNVGVILAALFFMRRMAEAVHVEQQIETAAIRAGSGPADAGANGLVIYSIDGPFFFGAAEKLERTLEHIQRPATTLMSA